MPFDANRTPRARSDLKALVEQVQRLTPKAVELVTVGLLDDNNSTTAVLGGGATFTGAATDVTQYAAATVHVIASHASAAQGLKLQTSSDGTNWDHSHDYTVAAGVSRHIDRTLDAQYFRVVYTNGGTLQTSFRLQVKLFKYPPALHVHPITHAFTGDHPSAVVRSVLAGEDQAAAGTYRNVQVLRTTGTQYDALATATLGPDGTALTPYVADAVAPAAPVGLAPLMVRDDQLSAVTPAEGDWIPPRGTADGALWVAIADAGGDPITTFGVAFVDDAAFTVATDSGTPMMGVFTTDEVDSGDAGVIRIDSRRNQGVVGDVAHDSADAGDPLKVGGKAFDYAQANAEPGQTAVAANDRANAGLTLRGEVPAAAICRWFEPDNIETVYDDSPTQATSSGMTVERYREFVFQFDLERSGSFNGDVTVNVLVAGDGTNYAKLMNDGLGALVYSNATIGSGGISRAIHFRARAKTMQIQVVCTGTTASNTFTMSDAILSAST